MATVQEVTRTYIAAWNESDTGKCGDLLAACWAEDGILTGPQYQVEGRAALVAHVADFQRRYPGARVLETTAIDAHHDLVRYGWRIDLANGSVLATGEDVGIVGVDGRFARILMFYGMLVPTATMG